jgi:tyrosine-protein kinase Etk/Wzc
MNAPHPLQQQLQLARLPQGGASPQDSEIGLRDYWNIFLDNRALVACVVAASLALGTGYAFLGKPVYESNLLIQVEDSATSAKSFLGEASSLFDVKTPASAEIEIIRSRMVLGQAVDNTLYYIDSRPRYVPVIGEWLARRAHGLSTPGVFGVGGWVHGTEAVSVSRFDVPQSLEGTRFRLVAEGNNQYRLSHPDLDVELRGEIGKRLVQTIPGGEIALMVSQLDGQPGAQFELTRFSRTKTIDELREQLKLAEVGRQSGMIDAQLQDSNTRRLVRILNEIGTQYVRQNVERKAAEAQKTLGFLDAQLPQFKKQLDLSEEAFNRYRNQQGTVALDEEAKLVLAQSVDLQSKLSEANQRRVELLSRFTLEHPSVRTLDAQLAAWQQQIALLNSRIKAMPTVQQEAIRLERDLKINNDLYQQLRNTILQMQLVREGKVGNVRLIDTASSPEDPVRPKKALTIAVALLAGLLLSICAAVARNSFFHGLRNPQELEAATGLNVYSTIPLSDTQRELIGKARRKEPGLHILAHVASQDFAVESLRSLRTALQFAILEAPNNRILITGATPGVGKSFVSSNFAAVLASAGKRVLLIDADLRKGHLNQYFGLRREGGLSELVSGAIMTKDALHLNVLPNLDVITTGMYPPNPAELVASTSFAKTLEALSDGYDYVIVDTAPVLAAADTSSISTHVGTVLLVARAEQTQVAELHESTRRLSNVGAKISGVIFNALNLERRHYGAYGYGYSAYRYVDYGYKPMGRD